jgi:hypothetical protein
MPAVPPVLLEMTALVLLVLFAAWYGPQIRRKKELQELTTLNAMYRYAKRHNTFVRNHNEIRFVVVLGTRGFHYMFDGQMVSRAKLLKAIGEENERILLKIEGEESRQGPTPTRLTAPA